MLSQSIYFDTPEDMAAALKIIAADEEAFVIRVTNRLQADYDAGRTLGYRDVGLNLRLATAATRRVGLDGHICEVQLVLADFAKIKVRPAPLPAVRAICNVSIRTASSEIEVGNVSYQTQNRANVGNFLVCDLLLRLGR